MLSVTLICFFFLFCCTNSLTTKIKTLDAMQTNLLQTLSRTTPNLKQGAKMSEIRETISQLIQLSKQDAWESYQRTSFDVLITKTREIVDDMLEEQRAEDIQYRNTTNILMNYALRQEHALEICQDKYKLSQLFIKFIDSIETTQGRVDIKTDYGMLFRVMKLLQVKLDEYHESQAVYSKRITDIYTNLKTRAHDLAEVLKNNNNPYMKDQMDMIASKLPNYVATTHKVLMESYNYNVNPKMEQEMVGKYVDFFKKQANNETRTIDFNFFPSFVKQTKEARIEILSLATTLAQAEEAMQITKDSLKSNLEEYEQNVKTRRDIVEVIYQILDLMNKRAKKIKGYQLKYIDVARTKFLDNATSYEFKAYKRYIFTGPETHELINKEIPKLPDLPGIEDKNAAAPKVQDHTNINTEKIVKPPILP